MSGPVLAAACPLLYIILKASCLEKYAPSGSIVEREKEKRLSPLRQKASVVSESMLIWDLAEPAWRKRAVRKKKVKLSWVILFIFAI